jgi:hypothetical protein
MSVRTLIREAGDSRCAKCVPGERGKDAPQEATHTLTTAKGSWRLCPKHAASASHLLGIPHICFNPEGKVTAP